MNSGDTRTAYLLLNRPLVEGLFLLIILPQTLRLNVAPLYCYSDIQLFRCDKSLSASGR